MPDSLMSDTTSDMLAPTQSPGASQPQGGEQGAPQGDALSSMLGENVPGLKGWARRYQAQKSGEAFDAARLRYQQQQSALADIHQKLDTYSQSGLTSPFTPELQKYYKSIGGQPALWDAAMQNAQAIAARRQSLHESLFGGGGMSPAGAPPATGAGATPSASDPTSAMLTGGGGQPAATAGQPSPPPTGPDGSPDWSNHDWEAHNASEPPYLKAQYDHLQGPGGLTQALIDSQGLPEHADIEKQWLEASKEHAAEIERYYGFQQKSQLQTQRDTASGDRQTRNLKDVDQRQAKVSLDNKVMELGREMSGAQLKLTGPTGTTDPAAVQPIVDSFNKRLDALAQEAQANGLPDPTGPLRVQMNKVTSNNLVLPDTTSGSIAPAGPAASATPPATASAKFKSAADVPDGNIIKGKNGLPDLKKVNGKFEPVKPDGK